MDKDEFQKLIESLVEEISIELEPSMIEYTKKELEKLEIMSSYSDQQFTDSEKRLMALSRTFSRQYHELTKRLLIKLFDLGFFKDVH